MRVVNVKKEKCSHYCGRLSSYKQAFGVKTRLGNPYVMENASETERTRVIKAFRSKLDWSRRKNGTLWKEVVALPEDATLGCWCAPMPCHCDVIIRAWKFAHNV